MYIEGKRLENEIKIKMSSRNNICLSADLGEHEKMISIWTGAVAK